MGKLAFGAIVAAGILCVFGEQAEAAGGLFGKASDAPSAIEHRMIVSISLDRTTLYDQIQYRGAPASFAWVLPIAGPVDVALSSDALFERLDVATRTALVKPASNCAPPPPASACANASSGIVPVAGVSITRHDVVGPYETVQIAPGDAGALTLWLRKNQFDISPSADALIQSYSGVHYGFLAMKLVPGAGVSRMRPVRVTSASPESIVPFRMAAVGSAGPTPISLWVVSEQTYVPKNVSTFQIEDSEIQWNWVTSSFNYETLRQERRARVGGLAWEIESSVRIDPTSTFGTEVSDWDPGDGSGKSVTAEEARAEDLAALVHPTRPTGRGMLTRIRAELTPETMTQDLLLGRASESRERSNVRNVTKAWGAANCASLAAAPCESRDRQNRTESAGESSSNGTFSCAIQPRAKRTDGGALVFGALASLVAVASRFAPRRRTTKRASDR